MSSLGLIRAIGSRSLICALAVGLLAASACKSDSGSGGTGGAGGDGGESGGKGGGGKGGNAGNAGGSSGSGGTSPDAGVDSGLPPPPEPVIEDYAAPNGKFPVSISFKTADDLAKNFATVGEVTQSADSDGILKVAKGKLAAFTYDTTPDKERTNTYEAFTATIKFHSQTPPSMWISFATDKNRNDGPTIGFGLQNNRPGPVGVSDVDNIFFSSKCWAVTLFNRGPQCAVEAESYGWTAMEPSMTPQTVKITVRPDKATKAIRARAEYMDATGELIDGSVYDWADLLRVNGEITFGLGGVDSDAFIDEITIKEAEPIADSGIIRLDEGDTHMHVWVPPGLGATDKIKGLLITAPDLSQPPNGAGDFAMFGHLRKFATAHGWALLGGVRGGPKEYEKFFKEELKKLSAKAKRPEMETVPVFIHHLLNTFSLQALSDADFAKRIIGFMADKPRQGGDINAGTAEKFDDYPLNPVGRAVPGFFVYSTISTITGKSVVQLGWYKERFFEATAGSGSTDGFALWALTSHGMQTNAVVDSWMLYLALLQDMIKQRTKDNDGMTALKAVDKTTGFLGYSEAQKEGSMLTTPTLEPFATKGFVKAPAPIEQIKNPQPDFLPGPATALVWQAFDHCNLTAAVKDAAGVVTEPKGCRAKKVWWTTSPKHGKPGESRLMKLAVDPSLAGWKKIEIYDPFAAGDVATPSKPVVIMPGGTLEYEFKNLTAGAHNFIARLTAADDRIYITHPVMAVFAP